MVLPPCSQAPELLISLTLYHTQPHNSERQQTTSDTSKVKGLLINLRPVLCTEMLLGLIRQHDIPEHWNSMGKHEGKFLAKCYLMLPFYLSFKTEVLNHTGSAVSLSYFFQCST